MKWILYKYLVKNKSAPLKKIFPIVVTKKTEPVLLIHIFHFVIFLPVIKWWPVTKGGFKSEETGGFLLLQNKYSKLLSWAENLNRLFTVAFINKDPKFWVLMGSNVIFRYDWPIKLQNLCPWLVKSSQSNLNLYCRQIVIGFVVI